MTIPGFTAEVSLNSMQSYRGSWSQTEKINDVYPALPCIYGRWCGPGCSGPGDPIDNVDACCKAHDECYNRRGYLDCICDQQLLACLQPKITLLTKKGRAAGAVWAWFKGAPCIPHFHFGGGGGDSGGGIGGGGGGGPSIPTRVYQR